MIKGKKGDMEQTIYFVIFEIILVAITALALFSYVNNLAKSTGFEKQILSRDFALTLDTLYMTSGNINYIYENKFQERDFKIAFGNSLVQISEEGNNMLPIFPYAANINIFSQTYSITTKEAISFSKTDNKLELNSEFNKDLFYCPYINTTKKDWKIFLDTDLKYSFQGVNIISGTIKDRKSKILKETPETISFYMGDYPANENPLKIYIIVDSSEIAKSRKLACIITNKFMQEAKTRFTSAEIIPIYETSNETDKKYVLTKGKVQVFVEVGNVNYPYENKEHELSTYFILLERALKEYFGEQKQEILCNQAAGQSHCIPQGINVCLAYGGPAIYKGCPAGTLCCNNAKSECELNNGKCIDITKEECKQEDLIDKKCAYSLKCCKQK